MRIAIHAASAALVVGLVLPTLAFGQVGSAQTPQKVDLPSSATLEGLPSVRVDSTAESTSRHELDLSEARKNPLKLSVRNGRFYWTSHEDRPLSLASSGPYTYLQSEPGSYIRLTQVNGHIYYVEHTDLRDYGSVTWWGELRIVLGR